MVDEELLSRKLSKLQETVSALRMAEDITWQTYQSDVRARAFVERYLHLAVEGMVDIANHLVSFHSWREPSSYRDLFLVLAEHGIIPTEHLGDFQNMASFRNMLVHHYEKIDDELVFGVFRKRLGDFDRFASLIVDWVQRRD
jgi:uncharacterized protein YutE (UPF0331/DUF86 family)